VHHLNSWTKSFVFLCVIFSDLLAWAVVKDWTIVESEQRGFNTPSKTLRAEGSNTPRKRTRMQSESPTPTSAPLPLKEPEASDKPEIKQSDGDVFDVISFTFVC